MSYITFLCQTETADWQLTNLQAEKSTKISIFEILFENLHIRSKVFSAGVQVHSKFY